MVERFDSIKAVVIFGSYARGEEKEGSDLDAYLVFDHLNPAIFAEVGKACREFFAVCKMNVSYPMCMTVEDFYSEYMKNGAADPIKYFESVVTYGELLIQPPSKEQAKAFCGEILTEAKIMLCACIVRDEINVKRLVQVVKTFVIALKLERYLTIGEYPKTLHELRDGLAGSELEIIPLWFEGLDLLQEKLDQNRADIIAQLFLLLNKTQNSLIRTIQN
jgi:hypothetical protein